MGEVNKKTYSNSSFKKWEKPMIKTMEISKITLNGGPSGREGNSGKGHQNGS